MRIEFSKQVKLAAYERAAGHCEVCSAPLAGKRVEYDHVIPGYFGGSGTVNNCRVMCRNCHGQKTWTLDIPAIAKSRRIRMIRAGVLPSRKITAWRRFDGTIVRAPRER